MGTIRFRPWGVPCAGCPRTLVPAAAAGLLAVAHAGRGSKRRARRAARALRPARRRASRPALPGRCPGGAVGAIRLWDAGVTWRELEPIRRRLQLDSRSRLRSHNAEDARAPARSCTRWARPREWAALPTRTREAGPSTARAPTATPRATPTTSTSSKTVASPVPGLITAYQIWNEANLRDFYLGTPAQMAKLTKDAPHRAESGRPGRQAGRSEHDRARQGPGRQVRQGLRRGHEEGRPGRTSTSVSAHFYPPATSGPGTRASPTSRRPRRYYKKYGAGKKPLWDTEMNFGDTRAYMKVKRSLHRRPRQRPTWHARSSTPSATASSGCSGTAGTSTCWART